MAPSIFQNRRLNSFGGRLSDGRVKKMDKYQMPKSSYDPLFVTFRTRGFLREYYHTLDDKDLRIEIRILDEFYAHMYRELKTLIDRIWVEAARLNGALRIRDDRFGMPELLAVKNSLEDIGSDVHGNEKER